MAGHDLGSILSSVEAGNVSAPEGNSMPNGTITTSVEKEKRKARTVFGTKTFYISDDSGAEEFASFINWIMEEGKNRTLLREISNFTPTGELVRICDYLRNITDKSASEGFILEEDAEPERDITREEPQVKPQEEDKNGAEERFTKKEPQVNQQEEAQVNQQEEAQNGTGERFTKDDYVSE